MKVSQSTLLFPSPNRIDRIGIQQLGEVFISMGSGQSPHGIGFQVFKTTGAEKVFEHQTHAFMFMEFLPYLYRLGGKPPVGKGDDEVAVRSQNPVNLPEYRQGVDKIFDRRRVDDYIRKARFDDKGNFILMFMWIAGL